MGYPLVPYYISSILIIQLTLLLYIWHYYINLSVFKNPKGHVHKTIHFLPKLLLSNHRLLFFIKKYLPNLISLFQILLEYLAKTQSKQILNFLPFIIRIMLQTLQTEQLSTMLLITMHPIYLSLLGNYICLY